MSEYFNHLRELASSENEDFDEVSQLARSVAYSAFLADNPDYFDDILVEPSNYLTAFRTNLLALLSTWDVDHTLIQPDLIIHLQAEFFVLCEHALFDQVADDYGRIRQNTAN